MRTEDLSYSKDYWDSYDNGAGYKDGTLWEDLAHIIKEWWGYDSFGADISGSEASPLIDVGCAHGFLVKHLRARGFDAWGMDISNYAVKAASRDVREFLRVWDMTTPNPPQFGWGWFERAICLETLEHVEQPGVALRNLMGLLQPGGQAFLAICVTEHPDWDTDPTHISVHSRSWWENKINDMRYSRDKDAEEYFGSFAFWRHHKGLFVLNK